MVNKSAFREMQDAIQDGYNRGQNDMLTAVAEFLREQRDTTLSPAEIERAFVERFGETQEQQE
jgi:hypothetical protein